MTDRIEFERDGVKWRLWRATVGDWADATPDDLRAAGWVPARERSDDRNLASGIRSALKLQHNCAWFEIADAVGKLKAERDAALLRIPELTLKLEQAERDLEKRVEDLERRLLSVEANFLKA